jgi:hypothetical protein
MAVIRGRASMSTQAPTAFASDVTETDAEVEARRAWIEAVCVAVFTAAAVVCASVLAVVTGLV